MPDKIVSIVLFIVGIINLLPIIVFFDSAKTVKLYGVPTDGESLIILMRHRAVLLGLVGSALIYTAFKPEFRIFAIALALVSKLTFIFLTFTASDYTAEVRQVALIDVGAIVFLLAVLGIHFYAKSVLNFEHNDLD
jgi:hypothetical protein